MEHLEFFQGESVTRYSSKESSWLSIRGHVTTYIFSGNNTFLCDKYFHYVASVKCKIAFADLQKKEEITSEGEIVTHQDV